MHCCPDSVIQLNAGRLAGRQADQGAILSLFARHTHVCLPPVLPPLREHETGLYLFRTPGNPRWQGVSLKQADWSVYGGQIRRIPLLANSNAWYGDVTAVGSELLGKQQVPLCTGNGGDVAEA